MDLKTYVKMLLSAKIEFKTEYNDTIETTYIIIESPAVNKQEVFIEATFSQSGKLVCIRGI